MRSGFPFGFEAGASLASRGRGFTWFGVGSVSLQAERLGFLPGRRGCSFCVPASFLLVSVIIDLSDGYRLNKIGASEVPGSGAVLAAAAFNLFDASFQGTRIMIEEGRHRIAPRGARSP